jgi:ribosome recycling factor
MCVSEIKKVKNGWCKEEDQKRAEEHRTKLKEEYIKKLKEAQKEG